MADLKVVLLLLLWGAAVSSEPLRQFEVQIYNNTCNKITETLEIFTCDFIKTAPSTFLFTNHFKLRKTLNNNFFLNFVIDVQQTLAKFPMRVLDLRFDICKDMAKMAKNPLLSKIVSELYSSIDFVMECPYVAGRDFKVENLTVSTANFPLYTPELNFNFSILYYDNQALFARQDVMGNTIFSVDKSGILKHKVST